MRNEKLEIRNEENNLYFQLLVFCCLIFAFVVFVIDKRRYKMSLQSFIMLSYSGWVNRLVSFNRSSQYSVSAASFNEIVAFTKNSFLLTAYWASVKFAPIDEPERNSCLASVYSLFSSHRCLYRLYVLIANFRLFSNATFFMHILNIRRKTVRGKRKDKNEE